MKPSSYLKVTVSISLIITLLCYTDSETTGEYDGYIPDTTPRWREHYEIIRLLHLGLL